MQGWTWRIVIVIALVTVLVYTATRPDPEIAGLYQSSPAQLVALLDNSREAVRRGAAAELLSRGADSVPALAAAIPTASDEQLELMFLVLEDLYVSADEATADAAEEALEQMTTHDERNIRHAADQVLQVNMTRRLMRACAKLRSFGARFVISPLAAMRGADSQFPYDIMVIGADWSGGDDGLKFLRGFRQHRLFVHVATDAPLSEAALRTLKELSGAVRRQNEGCLGLLVRNHADPGVLIRRLVPRSPAELAGLQENDILLQIDDEPIDDTADFMLAMRRRPPGTQLRLKILRRNRELDVAVALGSDFATGQCRCEGDAAEEITEPSVLPESEGRGDIGPAGAGRLLPPTTDFISPPAPGPARIPQRPFGHLPPQAHRP
jgi:hypothetical protein